MADTELIPAEEAKLTQLETTIREGMHTFHDVGSALLTIRDERLYRRDYKSFEEYCGEKWGFERHYANRLIKSSKVVKNLVVQIGDRVMLPDSERQTRSLSELPEEEQGAAWEEAVTSAPAGKPPTASDVEKVVRKRKPKGGGKKAAAKKESKGWTKEDLKADDDLAEAFTKIEKVYGKQSTDAIRHGAIECMGRADVLQLAKLPTAEMEKLENLIMANHWTPKKALAFLAHMPDENTTLEEMENYAIATKGGYTTVEIGGFLHTCKQLRK